MEKEQEDMEEMMLALTCRSQPRTARSMSADQAARRRRIGGGGGGGDKSREVSISGLRVMGKRGCNYSILQCNYSPVITGPNYTKTISLRHALRTARRPTARGAMRNPGALSCRRRV